MANHDHQLAAYLRETLGIDVQPTAWPDATRLPAFLTNRYRFLQSTVLGLPILFMVDASPEADSPANIRMHIAQVRPKCDWPLVYVREKVTAYNRKRLIEQRVPFVVPGNQMYLPHLGIDLREHFRKQAIAPDRLRPATQAILIHALLDESSAHLSATKIAPLLGYSSMTLSRAFDEIEAAGLAESKPAGKERILHLAAPRRELWNRAQSLLRDPVESRHFIRHTTPVDLGPKAGAGALAAYSMLAEPKNPVFAMTRQSWNALPERGPIVLLPMQEPDASEIEVWRYAPRPFRVPNVVDPLSLFLSLRRSHDERIEQALDQMVETLPW